jgi:ATP-binding cassette subfamily B protein
VIDRLSGDNATHGPLSLLTSVAGGSLRTLLTAAAVALLVITLASGAFDYLDDRVMNSAGERMTAAIRKDTFANLQRLPMTFHDPARRRGAHQPHLHRHRQDRDQGQAGVAGRADEDHRGTLDRDQSQSPVHRDQHGGEADDGEQAGEQCGEHGGQARIIHAFGSHNLHDARFAEDNTTALRAGLRAVELRARFTPLLEAITAVGTAMPLWVGGLGVLNGWWTWLCSSSSPATCAT